MNYVDFLMNLENIAICNELRLMMNRAPVGSGFFFYFKDDTSRRRSKPLVFSLNRGDPEKLFAELEDLAYDFRKELAQVNPTYEAYQLVCDILDGKKDDTYLEEVRGYLGQALDA